MSQFYSTRFGSADPRTFTGLSPTFLVFANMVTGTTNTPPAITEVVTGSGFYGWTYGVTQSICFLIDAATTSPGSNARYVSGQLDPADRANSYGDSLMAFGSSLVAIGTSNIALGTSNIALGTSNFAFGNSNIALGTSNIALGTTVISYVSVFGASLIAMGATIANMALFMGDTTASIGSTSVDPANLFGFLKRAQEIQEGAQIYTKASGLWDLYNRTQTVLLREKTIADSSSSTTRT